MYQADFICTYKQMDTESDKEDLYQLQLLQAFDLNKWDDTIVNSTLLELYKKMLHDNRVQFILLKLSKIEAIQFILEMNVEYDTSKDNTYLTFDQSLLIFSLLFQYEYFDLFHKCIIDFMRLGKIEDNSFNTFLKSL